MVRHLRLTTLVALLIVIPAVAVAAAPFAYITNLTSSSVLVIDTATNAAVAPIALPPGRSPFGVALSPDGSRVYVTHFAPSGTLLAIDTATGTLIREVAVGFLPFGVAVHPSNGKVYVSVTALPPRVVVIDPATFTNLAAAPVLMSIPMSSPRGLVANPAGTRLYVASNFLGSLMVYDAATYELIASVPVGGSPMAVAVSQDNSRVYVTNEGSNSLTVIDASNNTVIDTVPVGNGPIGVTITPDGSRVYVANSLSGTVSVLDANGQPVRGDITVGTFPYGISTDGASVYVAVQNSNKVVVIDRATNAIVREIPANMPVGFGQFVRPQLKVATQMSLAVSQASTIVGSTSMLTAAATLQRKDNGAPVAGASIAFWVDGGAGGSAVAGADGVARWSFSPSALGVGTHTVQAAFSESRIGGLTYQASSASAQFAVVYQFSWRGPANGSVTSVNAGATVPVRWSMTDASGNYISSLEAVTAITSAPCAGTLAGAAAGAVRASAAGASGLRYDATNQFMFNWKTDKSWAGQCRQFIVQLNDGTTHALTFQLK